MRSTCTPRVVTFAAAGLLGLAWSAGPARAEVDPPIDLSAFAVNLPPTGGNVAMTFGALGRTTDDGVPDEQAPALRGEVGDREIGATLAVVTGGDNTVGGMRVSGRFLYQLSDQDWFDGAASFTYGGDAAGCMATAAGMQCEHGRLSGAAVEVMAGVRRRFPGRGQFVPHLRAATGVRLLRFGADDVAGVAIPVVAAGGVRVRVAPGVAVGAEAAFEVGGAWLSRGLGAEPQVGMVVGAQVEFRLR